MGSDERFEHMSLFQLDGETKKPCHFNNFEDTDCKFLKRVPYGNVTKKYDTSSLKDKELRYATGCQDKAFMPMGAEDALKNAPAPSEHLKRLAVLYPRTMFCVHTKTFNVGSLIQPTWEDGLGNKCLLCGSKYAAVR